MGAEVAAGPPRRTLSIECAIASVGILAVLGALKHLGALIPLVHTHAGTVAAALQLYVPVMLIDRRGVTAKSLGLDAAGWRRDLLIVVALAAAITVPFAIGHHLWQTLLYARPFTLRAPDDLLGSLASQILVVALPEELYFRGYLQGRLEVLWPARRRLFGVPFGAAILTASAVFALAHFVGEYRFDRLGPFFPALLFGLLRTRTSSILAPVLLHAYCNILGDVLWTFYRSGP